MADANADGGGKNTAAAAATTAPPPPPPPLPPLFDRIGGMQALINAVDVFYARILDDPTLAPFFEGVEMSRQRTKQVRRGERLSFLFFSFLSFFSSLGLSTLSQLEPLQKK